MNSDSKQQSGASLPASDCYVATLECSDGNESVGSMWMEHHVCTAQTTIEELMAWKAKQRGGHGRLTIAKAT